MRVPDERSHGDHAVQHVGSVVDAGRAGRPRVPRHRRREDDRDRGRPSRRRASWRSARRRRRTIRRAPDSATTSWRCSRGTYYSAELDLPVTIAAREGVLVLTRPRADELRFVPLADDLLMNSDQMLLRVVRDANGRVTGFALTVNRVRDLEFVRARTRHPEVRPALGALRAPSASSGIFRPLVLRVSSAQILPHVEVARPPEAGEVARDLNRAVRRREQVHRHRHATVEQARRFGRGRTLPGFARRAPATRDRSSRPECAIRSAPR